MENGLTILLVEDNRDDQLLFGRAFEKLGHGCDLRIVESPAEGLDYLEGKGSFSDRERHPLPSVILIAINEAQDDDCAVLQWVRENQRSSILPIIVFSSFARDSDVKAAFEVGVHGYFEKPVNTDELIDHLRQVYNYWSHSLKPSLPATG